MADSRDALIPPRPSLKRRALLAGQRVLGASGAGDLYANHAQPNHAIVLMYHSVCHGDRASWIAPRNRMHPTVFERQLARLAKGGRVVPISRLLDDAEPPPPGSIVLTFDDGYLDNLEVVAPLLERYALPAVLYLATGYVSDAAPQWADVVYAAIQKRTRDRLELDGIGRWDLSTESACEAVIYQVGLSLIESSRAARAEVLASIHDQLESPQCPLKLSMDFDGARQLLDRYPSFELGVHTADHLDLSSVTTDDAIDEVRRSMDDFERELGRKAQHFSYPYSRSTPELIRRLPETGLHSAMTGQGVVTLDSMDPFDLHRFESPESESLFRYWTSGAHPTLTRKLFGRS